MDYEQRKENYLNYLYSEDLSLKEALDVFIPIFIKQLSYNGALISVSKGFKNKRLGTFLKKYDNKLYNTIIL